MEISFKPALLSSQKTWNLSGGQLTTPKSKILDLSSVTQAYFVNMPVKSHWIVELKLAGPDQSVTVNCNDTLRGQQRYQCFVLIAEILKSLQAHNPTLRIRYGHGQITNYAFACIGLIPIGFGLSFIYEGITDNFAKFPLGMGLGFFLFGIFIIWCVSPWKAPETYPPDQFLTILANHPNSPLQEASVH